MHALSQLINQVDLASDLDCKSTYRVGIAFLYLILYNKYKYNKYTNQKTSNTKFSCQNKCQKSSSQIVFKNRSLVKYLPGYFLSPRLSCR